LLYTFRKRIKSKALDIILLSIKRVYFMGWLHACRIYIILLNYFCILLFILKYCQLFPSSLSILKSPHITDWVWEQFVFDFPFSLACTLNEGHPEPPTNLKKKMDLNLSNYYSNYDLSQSSRYLKVVCIYFTLFCVFLFPI